MIRRNSRGFRFVARVVVLTLLMVDVPVPAGRVSADDPIAFVNATDTTCAGQAPCFTTIQAAISAAPADGTVRVQAGDYAELLIIDKKQGLVLEADPGAATGSVRLLGASPKCAKGDALRIQGSQNVTVRGFVFTGAGGQAIELKGGGKKVNRHVVLERNRIVGNGSAKCEGGILVGKGNRDVVVLNNLIYGNGQDGIRILDTGAGSDFVVQNTIHANRWNGISTTKKAKIVVADNIVTRNGTDAKPVKQRFGIRRRAPKKKGLPENVDLENNLVCGNGGGEFSGPVLDAADAGNLTPTGSEGPGVAASVACADDAVVFADAAGTDGQPNTVDDDFTLAATSPALESGVDPRTLAAPATDAELLVDFGGEMRPGDGDGDATADFDIGALEVPCAPGDGGDGGGGGGGGGTGCVNHPPVITSAAGLTAAIGAPYVYDVVATDPDGDPITRTLATAPPGMTISPTGHVQWLPTADQTGRHRVVIRAADDGGLFARQAFFVDVPTVAPPVARDDRYAIQQGQTLTVNAAGVLANDSDPAARPLTAAKLTDPEQGDVTSFAADGSFAFTAPGGVTPPPPLTPAPQAVGPHMCGPFGLVVGDLDGDGTSEAIGLGCPSFFGQVVVVKSDGSELFHVHDALPAPYANCTVNFAGNPAIADVDDDGTNELIVSAGCDSGVQNYVAALAYDPTPANASHYIVKWLSGPQSASAFGRLTASVSFSVARLAPNDPPSVLYGNEVPGIDAAVSECADLVPGKTDQYCRVVTILNGTDGTIAKRLYQAPPVADQADLAAWQSTLEASEMAPIVTDLDGDGTLEVLFQGALWHPDGALVRVFDGSGAAPARYQQWDDTVVADLDADGVGDIVAFQPFFNALGYVDVLYLRAFRPDGTIRWSFPLPDGNGANTDSRLTVADVNRDGRPDILFRKYNTIYAVDADGHLEWAHDLTRDVPAVNGDVQHSHLGVYDLNGDGIVEVVVAVQYGTLLFLRGDTGEQQTLFLYDGGSLGNTHVHESLVVDLDGDGHAEIVSSIGNQTTNGLTIVNGGANPWRAAPRWFSQRNWTGTEVDTTGHVPTVPARWWNTPDGAHRNPTGNVSGQQPAAPYPADPRLRTQAQFTYAASNGALPSEPATVTIDIEPPNRPPVITSALPSAIDRQTFPAHFQLAATDPDVGDTVTFALVQSTCGGTTVDLGGLLTQAAIGTVEGACTITVSADDGHGGVARRAYQTVIVNGNDPNAHVAVPNVVGQTQADAAATLSVAKLVVGVVSVTANAAPAGEVVAESPPSGVDVLRFSSVDLTVSSGPPPDPRDADGDGDGYSRNHGDCDDANPALNPGAPDGVGNDVDENCDGIDGVLIVASMRVTAPTGVVLVGEHAAFTATGVLDDGSAQDVTRNAIWTSADVAIARVAPDGTVTGVAPGTTPISAARNGKTANASITVLAHAADVTDPTAAITAPLTDTVVTAPTAVVGTATDASFARYVLAYAPAGTETFTTFAEGTSPVTAGTLGTFDPTVLENDQYVVRLTVYDRGGNAATVAVTVQVDRNLKIGNFSLAFNDVTLGTPGLPVAVVRTYDSRDKTLGDFGIGWRMDVQRFRVRTNRTFGTGWDLQTVGHNFQLVATDAHKVSVTLPSGRVEAFDLIVSPTSSGLVPLQQTNVVGFAPRPGTLGTLTAVDNGSLLLFGSGPDVELVDDLTLDTYAPKRFVYTALDGTAYTIHRTLGLERITDPNGNTIVFAPTGITHSSGRQALFIRDDAGRITQVTEPNGAVHGYGYDAHGDLAAYTDPLGNVSRFRYDGAHNLLRVEDPLGRVPVRNDYDDEERLIGVTDANGHRTAYDHDLANHTETITDKLGRVRTLTYDDDGNVLSRTDALGHSTRTAYDARGNVLSSTDALGHTKTYAYDGNDRPTQTTDALGHTSTFAYDSHGRILNAQDPLGRTTQVTYDDRGNTTAIIDPLGYETSLVYDGNGQVVRAVDAAGGQVTNVYDASGVRTGLTDALGATIAFQSDANGNPVSQVDAAGFTQTLTLDSAGRPTVATAAAASRNVAYDPAGRLTDVAPGPGRSAHVTYDPVGHPTALTRTSDGKALAQAYDAEGNLLATTDVAGRTTQYEYDAEDRLTRTVYPDGTTELRTHDAKGRLLTVTDPLGHTTSHAYDAEDREISVTDALGHVTSRMYDAAGQLVAETDPLGRVTTFAYDAAGRLVLTTFADGTTEHRAYDEIGNLVALTDTAGQVTHYAYDANRRLALVQDALGHTTAFEADDVTRHSAVVDANGHRVDRAFDAQGRLVATMHAGGGSETATYDPEGRTLSTTNGNGETVQYVYDSAGRLQQRVLPGNVVEALTYTADGLVATTTNAEGVTEFAYDAETRRLTRVTEPDGRYVRYVYDAAGRRTVMAHALSSGSPEDVTTYAYDAGDRLVSITDPVGGVTSYTYDAAGNRIGDVFPDGTATTRTFDQRNRVVAIATKNATATTIAQITYTLDAAGNRTRATNLDGSRTEWDYDALGRVVAERHYDGGNALTGETDYAYDSVGNLIARTGDLGDATYTYDADDQLLSGDGRTYSYDGAGNLVSIITNAGTTRLDYDSLGRLVAYDPPTGGATAYGYDFVGLRQSKTDANGTTRFLTDRNGLAGVERVLRETDAVGTTLRSYVYGLEPIARFEGGSAAYRHADGIGSTRLLTTGSTITDRYDYSAYGTVRTHVGSSLEPHLFAGEQRDAESGLYYLRARYYDPHVGRFVSRDPGDGEPERPLTLNAYLYANANPTNIVDPSGHDGVPTFAELQVTQLIQNEQKLEQIRNHVNAQRTLVAREGQIQQYIGAMFTFVAVASAVDDPEPIRTFFAGGQPGAHTSAGSFNLAQFIGAGVSAAAILQAEFSLAQLGVRMFGGTTVQYYAEYVESPGLGFRICKAATERAVALRPAHQADNAYGGILLCPLFVVAPPLPVPGIGIYGGFDRASAMGIMVHEWSHLVGRTADEKYLCRAAAALPPQSARNNADNYRCVVEAYAIGAGRRLLDRLTQ